MRTLIFLIMLLSSLTAVGNDMTPSLSEQTLKQLRDLDFAFSYSLTPAKQFEVSSRLLASAAKRLLDVGNPDLFSTDERELILSVCPSTLEHPDAFAVNAEAGGDKIIALVCEFQTVFVVFPANPSSQASHTAELAFHLWATRLLNPAWYSKKSDQRIEVLDDSSFFRVLQVLNDDRGDRRFIPWTRAESLKLAIDKNGRWLIFSVADLPVKEMFQPKGIRFRSRGSWFSDPPGDKSKVIRKMGSE